MSLVQFKTRWASVGEVRFAPLALPATVDLAYFLQVREPIPRARCQAVSTIVVDLRPAPEEILAAMNDTTRYEIRRAEQKDGLRYHSVPEVTAEEVARFCAFYDRFAERRKLARTSARALLTYARARCLDLSHVADKDGVVLGWHAHFRGGERARLLHSATSRDESADKERRNLLGRANRWHHWRDFLRLRGEGLREFDFGGIYLGDADAEQARIRSFKEKFGGAREDGFNCELALTWRGRLYALAKRLVRP